MLSAASLFHFTSTLSNLCGILTDGFRVHASFERMDILARAFRRGVAADETGIPMVCFCDIPLSQTTDHRSRYGPYTLGMTKEWGIAQGIAPVVYTTETGPLVRMFGSYATLLTAIGAAGHHDAAVRKAALGTGRLAYFFKPYDQVDANGVCRRFYDEREWRYVPESIDDGPEISRQGWEDPDGRRQIDAYLDRFPPLTFRSADITHIIVGAESEIPTVTAAIRQSRTLPKEDVDDILLTKITTADRIDTDY